MKSLLVLCLLSVIALSMAKPGGRGCIYIEGKCARGCEEGTHAYALGCGHKVPEPTCDVPEPVAERGSICDYTACYCDPPTVRDPVTRKCIPLSECPKKEKKIKPPCSILQ